jgi:hypothetical protein
VQAENEILVDQYTYVDSLSPIMLPSERMLNKDEQLLSEEKSRLRSLSGQLLWTTTQTRPDAAYDSCIVGNSGKEPTIRNILTANKAVRKIKSTRSRLLFPCLGDTNQIAVVTYCDATHASLPSGASQGAFFVFLTGNGRAAPFMWESRKLQRVTKSPLASETMELAEAADAGYLSAVMVQEAFGTAERPAVKCLTDSLSLIDNLKTSHVIQDSRLRVDVARIREMINLKEIQVDWIEKGGQLADPLTKAGASSTKLFEVLKEGRL